MHSQTVQMICCHLASHSVGLCYDNGEGVSAKAYEWFLKSANNGNVDAMFAVGRCFSKGKGVAQNDQKAFEWYSQAAEHDNPQAVHKLAQCYSKGRGVSRDSKEAKRLFQKAKDLGYTKQSSCANQ